MIVVGAPNRSEAGDFYITYIGRIAGGDVLAVLQAQVAEVRDLLDGISEERSLHRYGAAKVLKDRYL